MIMCIETGKHQWEVRKSSHLPILRQKRAVHEENCYVNARFVTPQPQLNKRHGGAWIFKQCNLGHTSQAAIRCTSLMHKREFEWLIFSFSGAGTIRFSSSEQRQKEAFLNDTVQRHILLPGKEMLRKFSLNKRVNSKYKFDLNLL